MADIRCDFETRSAVELRRTGADVYFEHPSTDVWCMAYAIDDGPIQIWTPDDIEPLDFLDAISRGATLRAFNAAFERTCFSHIMGPRYGWPVPSIEQWRCTMVMASSLNLPASLENVAPAVGLSIGKDVAGGRVMMQVAKPRKVKLATHTLALQKADEPRFAAEFNATKRDGRMNADGWERYVKDGRLFAEVQWWNDAEKLQRLYDYCKTDVEVEKQVEKRLLPLPKSEQALWQLDQVINQRGVLVDRNLAAAANKIVAQAQKRANEKMSRITDTEVTACTNVNQIMAYLQKRGVDVESVKKELVEQLLAPDSGIPADAREVLILRSEASKTSVTKINALVRGVSHRDGRARGLLQFYGASTGRWSGRRFQPQNLRRPEEPDIDALIEAVATGDHDYVEVLYGSPINAVSEILRGLLTAAPGHRIIAADLSNIEGRVLAWLADERWKVDAFREYDAGTGPDLYIKSYAETFNVPLFGKKDPRRQVGKVMELASGYQGGHGAYLRFGINDEKKLDELAALVEGAVDQAEWEAAEKKFNGSHGLSKRHWTALRLVIDRWRHKHVGTKHLWSAMEECAIAAVRQPGVPQPVNDKVTFIMKGSILHMRLPSGRALRYPYPELRQFEVPWKNDDGTPATKTGLTYMSSIDQSKKARVIDDPKNISLWARIKTYGGALVENLCQAVARDILAYSMPKLEAAGYPIILTVHDEIVCEVPNGHGSAVEMEAIMCEAPAWADGLPLAAEGFEAERYRK